MDAKTKAVELATAAHANSLLAGENVIYLIGLSFIIGSLFTVFILLLLDFMRRQNVK